MCVYVFVIPGMVGDKLFHRNRIAAVRIHAPINFLAAAHQRQYFYFCTSEASKLEASVRIDAPENFEARMSSQMKTIKNSKNLCPPIKKIKKFEALEAPPTIRLARPRRFAYLTCFTSILLDFTSRFSYFTCCTAGLSENSKDSPPQKYDCLSFCTTSYLETSSQNSEELVLPYATGKTSFVLLYW